MRREPALRARESPPAGAPKLDATDATYGGMGRAPKDDDECLVWTAREVDAAVPSTCGTRGRLPHRRITPSWS